MFAKLLILTFLFVYLTNSCSFFKTPSRREACYRGDRNILADFDSNGVIRACAFYTNPTAKYNCFLKKIIRN